MPFKVSNFGIMQVAEINIIGGISHDLWGAENEVGVANLKEQLDAAADATHLIVNINSPGGSVDSGFAMYEMLVNSGKEVTTRITGLCASIATIIAQAGTTIEMVAGGEFMIHNPWVDSVSGDADELQAYADDLKEIENRIAKFYNEKTGLGGEYIDTLMKRDTWMTAEEAKAAGFITDIIDGTNLPAAKSASRMLSMVNKIESTTGRKLRAVATVKLDHKRKIDMGILDKLLAKASAQLTKINNATYTLADGTMVMTDSDGEIGTGQTLTFEDGNPVPDGDHTLNDGRILVTEGGVILEVRDTEDEPAATVDPKAADKTAELLEILVQNQLAVNERLNKVDEALARIGNADEAPRKKAAANNSVRNPKAQGTKNGFSAADLEEFNKTYYKKPITRI